MSRRNLMAGTSLESLSDIFSADPVGNIDRIDTPAVIPAEGEIIEVPLDQIHTFKNHPFRVLDDARMEETVESIKEHGVLVPGVVRPRPEGGYEILSGHRRAHASKLAGTTTMPVIVKDCSDDEATIIMVDSNIQREDILPSEKARAYAMKYQAMKHQGAAGGISLEAMGEEAGESRKTIQRFIWLSRLNDELLQMVDEKKIGIVQGVDLSFLSEEAQGWVLDVLKELKVSITPFQSNQLKELDKVDHLTKDSVWSTLNLPKQITRRVSFNAKKLDAYFTPDTSNEEIEKVILHLLDEWKEKGGKA